MTMTESTFGGLGEIIRRLAGIQEHEPVPPGIRGALFASLDELTQSGEPQATIAIGTQVSVALLKLEWSQVRGESDKRAAIRERLSELADEWDQQIAA